MDSPWEHTDSPENPDHIKDGNSVGSGSDINSLQLNLLSVYSEIFVHNRIMWRYGSRSTKSPVAIIGYSSDVAGTISFILCRNLSPLLLIKQLRFLGFPVLSNLLLYEVAFCRTHLCGLHTLT